MGQISDEWKQRNETSQPVPPPEHASVWRDPREDEPWFRALDPVTQGQLLVEWRTSHHLDEKRAGIRVVSRRRGWREGVAVFVLANTVFAPLDASLLRTLVAALLGAGVGAVWHRIQAGRFQSLMTGVPVQLLIQLGFTTSSVGLMLSLFTTLAFAALACIVGTGREYRKLDGSEIR